MPRLRQAVLVLPVLLLGLGPAAAQVQPAQFQPGPTQPGLVPPGQVQRGQAAPAQPNTPDLAANHRRLVERRRAEERQQAEFNLLGTALRPRRDR